MAETKKKPAKGTIATAELQNRKDTGWSNWNITLKDGTEYQALSVPPDGPKDLKKGMEVTMWPGKFTKPGQTFGYTLAVEKEDEAQDNSVAEKPKSKASAKQGSESTQGKGEYWSDKQSYEQDIRDPKIERQKYIEFSVNMHIAALPHLEEPPTTTEEVEAYLDSAVNKGCAVYDSCSKL